MSLPIESFEVPGRASDQLIVHLKKALLDTLIQPQTQKSSLIVSIPFGFN